MNESLQRWLSAVKDFFAQLSTAKKVSLALVAALVIVSSLVLTIALRKDPYRVLYSDLLPESTSAVAKQLGDLNIPHTISQDRKSISVPTSRVDTARMELAKVGLPGQDVVGFEKFDDSTFGMSSYVQRIQYLRAIQGELTRSIQRIASVKRARVHVSMPPKKTFLEEQDPPKASVIIELKPGRELTRAEVRGIAHLVSSAVEGLNVRQVTIVDNQGKFLHKPDDDLSEGVSSALLEMQRSVEMTYEKRIVDLLTPVVGPGKVMAKVTAEIDPATVNTMEEIFDTENVVALSKRKNDEVSTGSRPNPIGIPGSRANLPGSEVENPPIPMASANSTRNFNNTKFAVPRKIQKTDKPSGSIRRLTVAVIVDGYYTALPDKPEIKNFAPRTEEELIRLRDVVANAVGFDSQRRDSITISSLPFKEEPLPELKEETQAFNLETFLMHALKNGLIALVVLMFFFLVLRPFLKWLTLNEVEKELATLPKTVTELEKTRNEQGLLSLANSVSELEEPESLDKKEGDELRGRIVKYLDQAPKKGVQVVQEWIAQDRFRKVEAR